MLFKYLNYHISIVRDAKLNTFSSSAFKQRVMGMCTDVAALD